MSSFNSPWAIVATGLAALAGFLWVVYVETRESRRGEK